MSNRWLRARQTKYAVYVTVYTLVVVTIVIVANVLAQKYNKSYDTTANQLYSFSEQTVKVVGGLKQDATITYFGRKPFVEAKRTLDRYSDLSHKVRVEYVDMESDPQKTKANNVFRPDTSIVQIGDRKQQARNLSEEEITSAFVRALKDKIRTICYLTGSGEHAIDDNGAQGYGWMKEALEREGYKTESLNLNLAEKSEVPGECTVIVAGGPQTDYPQAEVDSIKKFVEGGGRALIMLDAPLKIGRVHTADNNALAGVLQGWGIVVNKDFILDPLGERFGFGASVAIAGLYNQQHPIVRDLARVATGFPTSRSLEVKSAGSWNAQFLGRTSPSSASSSKLDSENPQTDANLRRGSFIVGAASSYPTGHENQEGRVVVFGSSEWLSAQIVGQPSLGNVVLALNTIDWLASDEDLIAVRPKAPEDRPITMNAGQMGMVFLTSLGLIPLASIIAGIAVWVRRR